MTLSPALVKTSYVVTAREREKVLRGYYIYATRLGGTKSLPLLSSKGKAEDGVVLWIFKYICYLSMTLNCEFIPLSRAK
tara:strand:- start:138511 stop:138747 length:237 start_codon:yes stop_codon:yes gene_type:complete